MIYARELFAHNDTIQALANLFGVIAGVVLIFTTVRWAVRFVRTAYRTSVFVAAVITRQIILRKAFQYANEPTSLIATLFAMTNIMIVSVAALAFRGLDPFFLNPDQAHAAFPKFVLIITNFASLAFVVKLCIASTITTFICQSVLRLNKRRRERRLRQNRQRWKLATITRTAPDAASPE